MRGASGGLFLGIFWQKHPILSTRSLPGAADSNRSTYSTGPCIAIWRSGFPEVWDLIRNWTTIEGPGLFLGGWILNLLDWIGQGWIRLQILGLEWIGLDTKGLILSISGQRPRT